MNKKIIDAMNDIDDEYIENAHKRFKLSSIITWANVGKLSVCGLCLFLIIGIADNVFLMGSNASYETTQATPLEEEYEYAMDYDAIGNDYGVAAYDTYEESQESDSKLIVTGDMRIETAKYDETLENILELVEISKGYAQSSSTQSYSNGNRYYEATFRIPSENYDEFIEALNTNNNVSYYSQNIDDITTTYTDLQARLTSLKAQEEKVIEFYKEAQNIDDLMSIESRLSDLQYQIESLESQIINYDVLTTYATLNISIEESIVHTTNIKFVDRLTNSFINGWHNFISGIEDIVLTLSYNLFSILLFIIIVVVICVVIKRKIKKVK